ncbi:MAG TPA: ATP-binding protein [Gemmatimonadales bacterium]|nr:ATP-binding protein [Gemmatimonadales bacterium]
MVAGHRIRLSATDRAPSIARRRVAMACDGLGDEETAITELLTSELVTNAVLHPEGPPVSGESITVQIERATAGVRVEVHDQDAQQLPMPSVGPQSLDTNGRGLYLLRRLASAYGTYFPTTGGKAVWFEIQQRARPYRKESTPWLRHGVRRHGVSSGCTGRMWSPLYARRVRLAEFIASTGQPSGGPCD